MQPSPPPYFEVIEFLTDSPTPEQVVAFQPSTEAQRRVSDLLDWNRTRGLTDEERDELSQFMQLDHIMTVARAKARLKLADTRQ